MSAWNPDIAPQAMVMNANGNSLPANTGPLPSTNCVTAGILSGGITKMIATPRSDDRADLHERRQVVARREQQPHRQHRRDEAVDHHRPGELRAATR